MDEGVGGEVEASCYAAVVVDAENKATEKSIASPLDGTRKPVAMFGGRGCNGYGCRVVFKVTPYGTETVLHAFKRRQGGDPTGSLISIGGYLYGTTKIGGSGWVPHYCGTIFAVRK